MDEMAPAYYAGLPGKDTKNQPLSAEEVTKNHRRHRMIRCRRLFFCGTALRAAVSAIVGKALLELLAGKEDAALHRTGRERHLLGYLAVLVACHMH